MGHHSTTNGEFRILLGNFFVGRVGKMLNIGNYASAFSSLPPRISRNKIRNSPLDRIIKFASHISATQLFVTPNSEAVFVSLLSSVQRWISEIIAEANKLYLYNLNLCRKVFLFR